ncbi:MAG: hypothetical protein ACYS4W_10745 [Planctomycetota bacterium]|jgi:hypothetical protein
MELSWPMKLRIALAFGAGAILIGILAWPLAGPADPFGVVFFGTISSGAAAVVAALAFLAGLIGYFLSWPHGREIGILAAPAGLAVWGIRSGTMGELIRQYSALEQRQALFAAIRWEAFLWLGIVAAGFAGVLLGRKLWSPPKPAESKQEGASKANVYLNAAIAVVFSVLLSQLCIRVLAKDVAMPDRELGSVAGQPAAAQIAFAVFVSFGVAGFVVKKFLGAGYIWPAIASAFVNMFAVSAYVKKDALEHLVQHWPAVFFSNSTLSILPVQMVAFGTLGSIAGYWLAVRYNYWRKHG